MEKSRKDMSSEHSRDNGSRKNRENTRLHSDRRLTSILDHITDGFIGMDFDFRHTFVNESAARFLRKEKEQLLGKELLEVFPEAKGTLL